MYRCKMKYYYYCIWLIGLIGFRSEGLQAAIDTLYICEEGEPVSLLADTSFAAYRWTPSIQLDNPTIARPTARPSQTTLYTVEGIAPNGDNLIVNGDFSQGNVGFSSQYTYSPGANPTQGVYGVFSSGRDLSPQFFSDCRDHTSGTGQLMVVDGSPIANQEVWCQTVQVQANTEYAFSTWVSTVLPSNPARLQFSINGQALGSPFSPPVNTCVWRQFYATWTAGAELEAEICVVNQNTNPNGNDFALDDFSFVELGEIYHDSFLVVVENIPVLTIDTAICGGSSFLFNGISLNPGTSETFQFTSIRNCDSLVVVNVGLLDTLFEYVRVDTLCPGEVFDFYGNTISQDTVLCSLISAGESCDTVVCLTAVYLTESAIRTELQMPSCYGDSDGNIEVEVVAGLAPFSYQWEDNSSLPLRAGVPAGVYPLKVVDAKGCEATRNILLEEPPILEVDGEATSWICNGNIQGQIEVLAEGGTAPWQFGVLGANLQSSTLIRDLAPGDYELVVQDANGCMAREEIQVPQPFEPTLVITGPSRASLGERIVLNGLTDAPGNLNFEWFPKDSLSCPSCAETEVLALQTTSFRLVVTDSLGCVLASEFLVQVDRRANIFIPNAFSPNGDGVNDVWLIHGGIGVERIEDVSIYDRWGQQLFSRMDCPLNDPACGWNGEVGSGEKMNPGVYVYTCTVKLVNGELEQYSGSILLTY